MKHTKLCIIFIILFSTYSEAEANPNLLNYFEKAYQNEKNNFLRCVEIENLPPIEQIYTKCKITDIFSDAAYIIYDNRNLNPEDILNKVQKFKAIKKTAPAYPKNMQKRGQMGYAIVKFDINKLGITENFEVVDGFCGNIYNPMTEFKKCRSFNLSSINAAKKLTYSPSLFNGLPIKHKEVLHRFTYVMAQEKNVVLKKGAREYNKLIKAMVRNDYENALVIANKYINYDIFFTYQKAVIKFYMKEYAESIDLFNEFSETITKEGREVNEEYHLKSFSMIVVALFNLSRFQNIVDIEKNYRPYVIERNKYESLLSMSNFYIGASFINTGNVQKGAFYMTLASRTASSKAQSDYFDAYIDRISNYL